MVALDRVVPARTFDSLMRVLRPSGEFLAELVAAGFDPRAHEEAYSAETWRTVLEIARRHRFAELSVDAGHRALGRAFLDGFAETLVGRVICVMLPLLGPERMLVSFPRYATFGRPDGTIEMKAEGPRRWRAQLVHPLSFPEFTAGVLARGLERTGATGSVRVENHDGDRFDLVAQW